MIATSISSSVKRAAAAVAVTAMLPLGLVACGNDDGDTATDAAGDSTGLSTMAPADEDAALGTDAAAAENEPAVEGDGVEGNGGAAPNESAGELGADGAGANAQGGQGGQDAPAAGGANGDTIEVPNGNGGTDKVPSIGDVEPVEVEPITDGKDAKRKDTNEVKDMLNDIYKQPTVLSLGEAMKNNACSRLIEAQGGIEAFDTEGAEDMSFADMGIDVSKNEVLAVDNMKIKDNRATADVTARTQMGESTSTVAFEKEDGRWKVCSA